MAACANGVERERLQELRMACGHLAGRVIGRMDTLEAWRCYMGELRARLGPGWWLPLSIGTNIV
jgi:hypothetical protein